MSRLTWVPWVAGFSTWVLSVSCSEVTRGHPPSELAHQPEEAGSLDGADATVESSDAVPNASRVDAAAQPGYPPERLDAGPHERTELPDASGRVREAPDASGVIKELPPQTVDDAQSTLRDAGSSAAVRDAASSRPTQEAAVPCENSLAPVSSAPPLLSGVGLYEDIAQKRIATGVLEFSPKYVLWSDGASKQRWLYLPECEVIDSSDMDDWSFPIGTRAFKQFSVDGKRIETRLVHRFGPGADDFLFAHYLWNEEETEAYLITEDTPQSELSSPRGTDYEVPTPDLCTRCHGEMGGAEGGLPSRFLGLSAIQLSHSLPGVTMQSLSDDGWLSRPKRSGYAIEANETQEAALGYMHANCGFCHNDTVDGVHFPASPMLMLLTTEDESPYDTGAYDSLIHLEVLGYQGDCTHRVYAGDPGATDPPSGDLLSCVLERMLVRDQGARQMPPLATHKVDEAGVEVMRRWIASFNAAD